MNNSGVPLTWPNVKTECQTFSKDLQRRFLLFFLISFNFLFQSILRSIQYTFTEKKDRKKTSFLEISMGNNEMSVIVLFRWTIDVRFRVLSFDVIVELNRSWKRWNLLFNLLFPFLECFFLLSFSISSRCGNGDFISSAYRCKWLIAFSPLSPSLNHCCFEWQILHLDMINVQWKQSH